MPPSRNTAKDQKQEKQATPTFTTIPAGWQHTNSTNPQHRRRNKYPPPHHESVPRLHNPPALTNYDTSAHCEKQHTSSFAWDGSNKASSNILQQHGVQSSPIVALRTAYTRRIVFSPSSLVVLPSSSSCQTTTKGVAAENQANK